MKRRPHLLIAAVLAVLAPSLASAENYQASKSAPINTSTAVTTQLVPAVNGQGIYVTSFNFVMAASQTVQFEYGSGATCGTGTTILTGAYAAGALAELAISSGSGVGLILAVPAAATGNALCMVTSAATQVSGSVSYTQQ